MTSPTNEQQRVDVLLRMDAFIGSLQAINVNTVSLEQARAAVAELIEAAGESLPHIFAEADRYLDDGQNEPLEAYRKLRAALATVGAQK